MVSWRIAGKNRTQAWRGGEPLVDLTAYAQINLHVILAVQETVNNRAHAKLRSPGERANAQLKTWHILRKLRCCPWRAGQLAKAVHVVRAREANAG